jgi:hypothetical protein
VKLVHAAAKVADPVALLRPVGGEQRYVPVR